MKLNCCGSKKQSFKSLMIIISFHKVHITNMYNCKKYLMFIFYKKNAYKNSQYKNKAICFPLSCNRFL